MGLGSGLALALAHLALRGVRGVRGGIDCARNEVEGERLAAGKVCR